MKKVEGRFRELFLDRVEGRAAPAAGNYFRSGSKVEGVRRPTVYKDSHWFQMAQVGIDKGGRGYVRHDVHPVRRAYVCLSDHSSEHPGGARAGSQGIFKLFFLAG